jgi:signal transduction histidine kinase
VANARDAMPAGGRLRVSVARDAARAVALRVSDSGTGMTEEVAARAFDPFFTTKARGEGTGLGLASVKSIVEAMGGTVALETAPGAGTTVTVILPAA